MCFWGFQPVELSFDFTLLLVQGMTRMPYPPTDCIVNSALQFSVSNIIIPKIRYSEY